MMTPDDFRAWRKALGWKQKEAAERLGLRKRMIQYYEKGNRDGKDVKIPKTVRLACYALANGIDDFDGTAPVHLPEPAKAQKAPAAKAAKPAGDGKAAKPAGDGGGGAKKDEGGGKKPAKRKAAATAAKTGGAPRAGGKTESGAGDAAPRADA